MGRLALAGRPLSGDHGRVDQAASLALLEQGELAPRAPRLGGMARADGVVIVSERFWAFAGIDGSLREGTMPQRRIRCARFRLRAVSFVSSASLSPLFRAAGRRPQAERIFLARRDRRAARARVRSELARARRRPHHDGGAARLAVARAHALPARRRAPCDRRARGTAPARHLARRRASPSRFSLRCGTNFAALLLPVAVFGGRFWPLPATAFTPLVVSVLALALTMELWQLVQSVPRLARVCSCRVSACSDSRRVSRGSTKHASRSPRSPQCSAASSRPR